MLQTKSAPFSGLLALLLILTSCQGGASPARTTAGFSADVAASWFDLELKLVKETPGFSPPVSSRAFGYSGVALYESVVNGMPDHNSLVGQLNGLVALPQPEPGRTVHWGAAANSALATVIRYLYPTATPENLAAIATLEQKYAERYMAEAGSDTFHYSAAYGKAVAKAVFEWSKSDGGHEGFATNFPESYTPPTGPGLWVSTPPRYQSALQPYWGQNRAFVLRAGEECVAPAPPEYSEGPSSHFYMEALEIYTTGKDLSSEQKAIALFWADEAGQSFTPPGHSISIATEVIQQQNASLALVAEKYAKVGIAVADAFIGCWNTKYTYNLIRPISYIQAVIDPTWNIPDITDAVTTPPFPEYTSGHSVQSGAAAAVLTALFGDDYQFTDNTQAQLGLPARSFSSFFEAAEEAAISRLYGGIHYWSAIKLGLEQGKCIGQKVNALAWTKQP